jgi:predicted MFS family arabinose efflux permease
VIDNFTWPWVFALPVVMAIIAFAMTLAVVPHSREHHEGRFDTVGSVLSAIAVGALVLGIHEGPEVGWSAPLTVTALIAGVAAAIGFAVWELRQDHPLLDLRVFRNRMLASGSFALLVTFAVMTGLFLVVVQYLMVVLGYSAIGAAAGLIPLALLMMPLSAVAPLIARRVGMRVMFVGGSLFISGGLATMAAMASIDGGYLSVLPGMLIMAIGVGLIMTPGTTAITASLPPEEQGVASALNDTVREVGAAVGVALLGSVMSAGYSSAVSNSTGALPAEAAHAVEEGIGGAVGVSMQMADAGFGEPAAALMDAAKLAFLDGWTGSMWVSAGIALLVAVVSGFWTPSRRIEHAGAVVVEEPAVA